MNKYMLKRLRFFMMIALLVMLLLVARLAWLQIYRHDYYFARAEDNRIRELPVTAARGEIYDRHGELLAGSRPGFTVSLLDFPKHDRPEVIRFLSELLEMEEGLIQRRIAAQRYRTFAPIRLKNDVSAEVVAKIRERQLELPGVIIETEPVRRYPNDSLAAHVLGHVGEIGPEQLRRLAEQDISYRSGDKIGAFGLESAWEQTLRGQDGRLIVETNRYGQRVRVLGKENPIPGGRLHLTLDVRLQRIIEQAFSETVTAAREQGNDQAGRGAVVILNPNNGEILAMASFPAYNPNTISKDIDALNADPNNPQVNRTIFDGYPAGSTLKMLGAVAGLEEGVLSEKTRIICTGRKIFFRGERPRACFRGTVHGALNVVEALAKSCNIFFFELALLLGIDTLERYARDLGFGLTTGLTDIGGESGGIFDSREWRRSRNERWNIGDVLSVAIGQADTQITPLQLANYAAMLANGGFHYRPRLLQSVTDYRGETVYRAEPEVLRRLLYNEETWRVVRQGMEAVTLPGGTAASLRQLPVRLAGKTGTAETGGQGTDRRPHSLFVGYAPAEAPEIAIAVIVEHVETGTVVPLVARIISEYYQSEAKK